MRTFFHQSRNINKIAAVLLLPAISGLISLGVQCPGIFTLGVQLQHTTTDKILAQAIEGPTPALTLWGRFWHGVLPLCAADEVTDFISRPCYEWSRDAET